MDKTTILEILDELEDVPNDTRMTITYDDIPLYISDVCVRDGRIYIKMEEFR